MTVEDVYGHYYAARQRVSFNLHWQLRSSRHGNPYLPGDAVRRDYEQAKNYALTLDRRKAAWEIGPDEGRIIHIGGELHAKSKFPEKHPEAMQWLASLGCSEAEAVRRFEAQQQAEREHPFWSAKTTGKKIVKRTTKMRRHAGGIHDHSGDGGVTGAGTGDSDRTPAEPRSGGE